MDGDAIPAKIFAEFEDGLVRAFERIQALSHVSLDLPRGVGRKQLPTTVGGLVIHIADHTQRHVGQAVTTAKILMAERAA